MRSIRRQIMELQHKDITEREPRLRFSRAKRRSKKTWELTEAQYTKLVTRPCSYCGETKFESGVGLDRIDNQIGYVRGNVLPCCHFCNVMKNIFPTDMFLNQVIKIYRRIR